MNPLDKIADNAVLGFGFLGAFAGQLLGGSAKERTNQIVLYGALGAAAGYFFNQSRQQRTKAIVAASAANTKAAEAVILATEAKKMLDAANRKPKVKTLGGASYGEMMQSMGMAIL